MKGKDAYALVDTFKKTGIQEIDVLGGEPMLVPWMKDFVKYATDSDITLNISTNGSLPDIVNQFAKIQTGIMNIGFSLHGFSKTHNSLTMADNFLKVITGIKIMIEAGKNPIVKSILLKENKNEIYDLILFLRKLGIKRYYLLHEDIIGRPKNMTGFSFPEFRKFYSRLKKFSDGLFDIGFIAASGFYKYGIRTAGRCNAGITKIAILPDGSAFPCNLFFGFKAFRLGNLFEDGIEKIWSNPVLDKFKKYNKNICTINNCDYYSTCMGGCPAHSYYFYGSFDVMDPRCKIKTS
jgi:radical SAM protein with 4Fe4S-binding SPASM domain